MKAFVQALLPLCLISMPAIAQQKEAPKLGCIQHIEQTDKQLRLKGAILITQMMNKQLFIRTYFALLPNPKGQEERVVVFIMAMEKEGAPELPTRVKCFRETDGKEFELLQLIFPLNEERA